MDSSKSKDTEINKKVTENVKSNPSSGEREESDGTSGIVTRSKSSSRKSSSVSNESVAVITHQPAAGKSSCTSVPMVTQQQPTGKPSLAKGSASTSKQPAATKSTQAKGSASASQQPAATKSTLAKGSASTSQQSAATKSTLDKGSASTSQQPAATKSIQAKGSASTSQQPAATKSIQANVPMVTSNKAVSASNGATSGKSSGKSSTVSAGPSGFHKRTADDKAAAPPKIKKRRRRSVRPYNKCVPTCSCNAKDMLKRFSKDLLEAMKHRVRSVDAEFCVNDLASFAIIDGSGEVVERLYASKSEDMDAQEWDTCAHVGPENLQKPLSEITAIVKKALEGKIVLGHSLKKDLNTVNVKIDDKFIRDTLPLMSETGANIFGQVGSLMLKDIMARHGVVIQRGTHCPVEDSTACLYLYLLYHKKWEK